MSHRTATYPIAANSSRSSSVSSLWRCDRSDNTIIGACANPSLAPGLPSLDVADIRDEPGMEERFQRALRKSLNTPPKHRTAPTPKTIAAARAKDKWELRACGR